MSTKEHISLGEWPLSSCPLPLCPCLSNPGTHGQHAGHRATPEERQEPRPLSNGCPGRRVPRLPPPRPPHEGRQGSPPLHQYIKKLLFTDLNMADLERILRQMRRLPWSECEGFVVKQVLKVHRTKFGSMYLLGALTAGLGKVRPGFAVALVDELLEGIRVGLEKNEFRHQQRRLAAMCLLGELYSFKVRGGERGGEGAGGGRGEEGGGGERWDRENGRCLGLVLPCLSLWASRAQTCLPLCAPLFPSPALC